MKTRIIDCIVEDGLCITHGFSVSSNVTCPEFDIKDVDCKDSIWTHEYELALKTHKKCVDCNDLQATLMYQGDRVCLNCMQTRWDRDIKNIKVGGK